MKKIYLVLCLLCCAAYNLVAQTTQTPTNLYIKLADASGIENNAYVPEMNLFVADMVKELPTEFQDGKFKVFELGCYSIQEYTEGGYKEAVDKYFRNDSISNAENALFIGKRCENGIFTSFYTDIKLNHALEGCLDSKFPTWRTVFSKKINDAINLEMKNSKFSINQTHLAIKKGLLAFQKLLPDLLEDCEDNMMLMQPKSFVVGFKSNTRSATEGLDFKKPVYFFWNNNYIKVQFGDKINSITPDEGKVTYNGKDYYLAFSNGFRDFLDNLDDKGNLILPQSSSNGISSFASGALEKCKYIKYCRANIDSLCKLGGNLGFVLLEEGKVNEDLSAWIKYLNQFDKINKSSDFQNIINKLYTLGPDEMKKFLIDVRGNVIKDCSIYCGNIDIATLSNPPSDAECQACIVQKIISTLYTNYESVFKELVAKLPADKQLIYYPNKDRVEVLFKKLEDNPQAYTFGTTSELCSILEYLGNHNEISNRNRQVITIFNKVSAENTPSFIDTLEKKTITYKTVTVGSNGVAMTTFTTKTRLIKFLFDRVTDVYFADDDLHFVNAIRGILLRNQTVFKKKYDEAKKRNLDGGHSLVVLGEPVTAGIKPYADIGFLKVGGGNYNRVYTDIKWGDNDEKIKYSAEEFAVDIPIDPFGPPIGVSQSSPISLGKSSYEFSPFDLVVIFKVQDIESITQNDTLLKYNDPIADSTYFEKTPGVFFMPAIGLVWGRDKKNNFNTKMFAEVTINVVALFSGAGEIKLAVQAAEMSTLRATALIIEYYAKRSAPTILRSSAALNLLIAADQNLKKTWVQDAADILNAATIVLPVGAFVLNKGVSSYSKFNAARLALTEASPIYEAANNINPIKARIINIAKRKVLLANEANSTETAYKICKNLEEEEIAYINSQPREYKSYLDQKVNEFGKNVIKTVLVSESELLNLAKALNKSNGVTNKFFNIAKDGAKINILKVTGNTSVQVAEISGNTFTIAKDAVFEFGSKLNPVKLGEKITKVFIDGVIYEVKEVEVFLDETGKFFCNGVGTFCFAQDTKLPEGCMMSEKQTGDLVSTIDPDTKLQKMVPISKIRRSFTTAFTRLFFAGTMLSVTPAHALQTESGEWLAAGQLQRGDHVRSINGTVTIDSTYTETVAPTPVISYELEGGAAYLVGSMPVVVSGTCDLKTIKDLLGAEFNAFQNRLFTQGLKTAERAELYKNFIAGGQNLQNFLKTEKGIIAWSSVAKARGLASTLKTDLNLLTKVDNLLADQSFLSKIGGQSGLEDIIKANLRAACKSCTKIQGAEHLQNISDYLDDVKHFVDNYGNGIDGFGNVLQDLKLANSTGSYNKSMEGAAFMIRVLKKNSSSFAGKITKFEGSIDDLTNGCRYDILFQNGGKVTFGEFKSYASGSLSSFLTKGGDTYKQFLTYIGKIDDLEQLHYYFDAGKITDVNLIKDRLRNVISDNKADFFSKLTPSFQQKYAIFSVVDLTNLKIDAIVNIITKLE